jgi:hypothetical protein
MSQRVWLQGHLLLDEGVEPCPSCDAVEPGAYCRHCGTAKAPRAEALTACPQCHMLGLGPHCIYCGTVVRDAMQEQLDRGEFDWGAWRAQLAPALARLTEQAQHG